jgi:hypothetical protein
MRFARYCFVLLLVAGIAAQTTSAQEAEKSIYVTGATSKYINFPGIPGCAQGAVQKGDPFKGDAVLLLKVKPGCTIPCIGIRPSSL